MVAFGAPPDFTKACTHLLPYLVFERHLERLQPPSLSREQAIEAWRSHGCSQVADMLDYLKDYPKAVFTSSSVNIDDEMYTISIGSLGPDIGGSDWLRYLAESIERIPANFLPVFDRFVGSLLASEQRVGSLSEDTALDSGMASTPDD